MGSRVPWAAAESAPRADRLTLTRQGLRACNRDPKADANRRFRVRALADACRSCLSSSAAIATAVGGSVQDRIEFGRKSARFGSERRKRLCGPSRSGFADEEQVVPRKRHGETIRSVDNEGAGACPRLGCHSGCLLDACDKRF
jgi:hypothetical protein